MPIYEETFGDPGRSIYEENQSGYISAWGRAWGNSWGNSWSVFFGDVSLIYGETSGQNLDPIYEEN